MGETPRVGKAEADIRAALNPQGFALTGQIEAFTFECCYVGERAVLIAVVEILLSRYTEFVARRYRFRFRYQHQSLGFVVGQRPEQNCVNHAEHSGVGADTQSQREDCDQGEARRFPQLPHPVTKILHDPTH